MKKPWGQLSHRVGHIYLVSDELKNSHFLAKQLSNLLQTAHSGTQCCTGVQKSSIIIKLFSGVILLTNISPLGDQGTRHKSVGSVRVPLAPFYWCYGNIIETSLKENHPNPFSFDRAFNQETLLLYNEHREHLKHFVDGKLAFDPSRKTTCKGANRVWQQARSGWSQLGGRG